MSQAMLMITCLPPALLLLAPFGFARLAADGCGEGSGSSSSEPLGLGTGTGFGSGSRGCTVRDLRDTERELGAPDSAFLRSSCSR